MAAAWAIPVGVLSGLCVLMFVFIWWWFPRHYQKGIEMDMAEVDEDRRQRELYQAQLAQRAAAGDVEGAAAPQVEGAPVIQPPPPRYQYRPQAYTSY